MDNTFYYSQIDSDETIDWFLNMVEEYSTENYLQTYVLNEPLGDSKYDLDYERGLVLLMPGHKLIFVNYGEEDNAEFQYYIEDFIDAINIKSTKYDYLQVLGKPRNWKGKYIDSFYLDINKRDIQFKQIAEAYKLRDNEEQRKADLLVSLIIGSINSIEKIGTQPPIDLLEKVKKKIVLYDADQTRFIFQKLQKKKIVIQGLAGAGKTELLLHKLKELYISEENYKIAFTCHSKTLANNLRYRVPNFFTFMRVEEQIKWDERLWVMNGWGSGKQENSGLYSLICHEYNIPFQRWSYTTDFDKVCKDALDFLNLKTDIEPFLDYILIDESQDFPESFFQLCERVVKKSVFIAGDIFQNIYDDDLQGIEPDFLLNRSYRTDPRTLMFSHAIGMGLFERPVIRWLTDSEWEACGYNIDQEIVSGREEYTLSRDPVRRFEDIYQTDIMPVEILETESSDGRREVINVLKKIIHQHPTVTPDDISIVFIDDTNMNYRMIDSLAVEINNEFGWNVNKGYEQKNLVPDTLFISNKYNIKGLEFPFVICIANGLISRKLKERNTMYMTLTRSFISSYLILNNNNSNFISNLKDGLTSIYESNSLKIIKPHDEEIENGTQELISSENTLKSQRDIIYEEFEKYNIPVEVRDDLASIVKIICKDSVERVSIRKVIESNKDNLII